MHHRPGRAARLARPLPTGRPPNVTPTPPRPAPAVQHLNMIQYMKGQHVICAAPHVIEEHLRKCGSAGLEVDPTKIVWCPVRGAGGRSRGAEGWLGVPLVSPAG